MATKYDSTMDPSVTDMVELRGHDGDAAITSVPIASLHSADSPRVRAEDPDHVRMLMESEGALPPIVVHRPTMRVVDGMHRVQAALLRGEARIDVRFVDVPERDLFLLAVRLNAAHGLPLSPADRRAAAARILVSHPHWSDRTVAAATGLAAKTVRVLRLENATETSQLKSRIGRDGRLRPLSAAAGRRSAGELVKANPQVPLRQIAKQAGISLGTAADVRDRVLRGEDPVRGGKETPAPREAPLAELVSKRNQAMVMRTLVTDPSLRFTDSGRELLRWLGSRVIDSREWQALLDELPSHCTGIVAQLARQCSESWREFAEQLERRHPAAG